MNALRSRLFEEVVKGTSEVEEEAKEGIQIEESKELDNSVPTNAPGANSTETCVDELYRRLPSRKEVLLARTT